MQIKADQWHAICKATHGDAGKLLAEVNAFLAQHPQPTALTVTIEEARAIREGFLGETGSLAMQRVVNAVLSRRTAEPHPAEPVPAPSGDVITAMCFAYEQALMRTKKDSCRESMTAAYNVARAELAKEAEGGK